MIFRLSVTLLTAITWLWTCSAAWADALPEFQSVSCSAAIVSSGTLRQQGSTPFKVAWGHVWADGDIRVRDLNSLEQDTFSKTFMLSAEPKFNGAGIDGTYGPEQWVGWHCSGLLMDHAGNPIFPSTIDVGQGSGNYIDDFFTRFRRYQLGSSYGEGGLTLPAGYTLDLLGEYDVPFDSGSGIYYANDLSMNAGALTQQDSSAGEKVDEVFSESLNYFKLRELAISRNSYCRPGATGFENYSGVPLWVKPDRSLIAFPTNPGGGATRFTNVFQVSKHSLIPSDEPNAGLTSGIPSDILFVDNASRTLSGAPVNLSFATGTFFWPGILYINGNLTVTGPRGADVFMKNPTENSLDPTGKTLGRIVPDCIVDGILCCNGYSGSYGAVYGSFVKRSGTGAPTVYYHQRTFSYLASEPLQFTSPETTSGTVTGELKLYLPGAELTADDFTVENGTNFSITRLSATEYEFTLTPVSEGAVSVAFPGREVIDVNGDVVDYYSTATCTYDVTPPQTSLVALDAMVVGNMPAEFDADVFDLADVTSQLYVRGPASEGIFADSGTTVSIDETPTTYSFTQGSGRYEFTLVATDAAGNSTPVPTAPQAVVFWNEVENQAMTLDTSSDLVFPMTDDTHVSLTLTQYTGSGTVTVSRVPTPATYPAGFRNPTELLTEQISIEASGISGIVADLEWCYDPDHGAEISGSVNALFRLTGEGEEAVITEFPASQVSGNVLRAAGITGFSDWYAGNSTALPVTVSEYTLE